MMIKKALEIACEKMSPYTRYDQSPMMDHSVNTAMIVIEEIGLGRNSTIATLFHDVVRLNIMNAKDVANLFGSQIESILKGLNNISEVDAKISSDQASNFRDLIVSYSSDPRVILIKLADRLEVMRTISIFPEQKRHKKAWESLNLYAEIAHKLGLYSIKSELEDVSLSLLEPEMYEHIKKKLEDTDIERKIFIDKFLIPIREKLDASEIEYHIKSRTKSIYSIWNKMRKTNVSFEEVFDIFALRIIFDTAQENEKQVCWHIYSIVTDFYTPNPKRMRDWISIPKSNGYESLHTTVVTPEGQWVEIQIRSERMDAVAERGIAAHWRYKGVASGELGSEQWLGKLREIMENTEVSQIAQKFDSKLDSGEIFVFTPNGDIRKLSKGACVLDFAFDIHSNLGCTCTGAKVNGRNVSIREELKIGDIVTIATSKNQKPKADWLNFVTSNRAKNKIKTFLREEQAKEANLGREELERKAKNWKITLPIDEIVNILCRHYKLKTGVELYGQIAAGKIDLAEIKDILVRHLSGEVEEPKIPVKSSVSKPTKAKANEEAIIINELTGGMQYKFGKCCNPIFGDEVFGFITIGTGITIHRDDCPNAPRLKELYPYRILSASWRSSASGGAFRASVKIVADDTVGIVNRITDKVNEVKVNIRSMSFNTAGGIVSGVIDIEVTSALVIDTVIHSILKIRGIQKAYKLNR
ncbi:MAG: RelA/SpoT family protein [Rikenellaceae bacterium]